MTGSDEPVHTTEVDEDEPSDALDRAAPATSVPWDLTQLRSDDIPAMAAVPQPEPAAPEYRATVHELSERLRELQRPIRILSALQWPVEVQERFFAAGAQQQPEVTRTPARRCVTTSGSCSGRWTSSPRRSATGWDASVPSAADDRAVRRVDRDPRHDRGARDAGRPRTPGS